MKAGALRKYFVWAMILVFAGVLVHYRIFMCDLGLGDTAFLTQMTDNIATRGKPVSQIASSFNEVFQRVHFTPGEVLCNSPLPLQPELEFNYFKWHAYGILYLLCPLTWIFGAKVTLSVLTALCFAAVPCGAYLYLRRQQVSILNSLLICAALVAHPAWSLSLQGQLYADRFFVGLGFIYFIFLGSSERRTGLLIFLLLLGSTISERYGLVLGSCTIMYLVLNWTPFAKARSLYLCSFVLICISAVLLKFFIVHPQNAAFSASMAPKEFIRNVMSWPGFAEHLCAFILLNGVFALIAWRSWRLVLVAVFAALPNMLGNIGGVEKGQYMAHYHSTYFAILAASVVLGAKASETWLSSGVRLVHLIVFLMLGHDLPSFSLYNLKTCGPVRLYQSLYSIRSGDLKYTRETYQAVVDAIPEGRVIVASEHLFPVLYPKARNVQLYPLGLDEADYLVVPWRKDEKGQYIFPASYSCLGAEECAKQDALIAERLRKRGVDMDNPIIVRNWAIIKLR